MGSICDVVLSANHIFDVSTQPKANIIVLHYYECLPYEFPIVDH